MKKRLTAALIAGIAATTLGVAGISDTASAATPREGAECIRDGVNFLRSNGLLRAAALREIDYSTLADPVAGPIFTTLPAGSNLSLGAVIRLHYTNPELFAWCA